MILQSTPEQRSACTHAADLLANQAEGLRQTGSITTTGALTTYVATLRKIAAAASIDLTAKEKVDVEQSTFVLEGIRDGLLTAEFKDRADKINNVIRALNALVENYNAAASG
jgi:hypothetical protein